jgi:hypothetical protein
MTKSKIYNLNDGAEDVDERGPLTFADLEIGDVFRFADWDRRHPCEVSAIRWKVSSGEYVRLTTATAMATATGTATEMEMEMEMEMVTVTVTVTAMDSEVVRYDLGLKLSNPQRYRED